MNTYIEGNNNISPLSATCPGHVGLCPGNICGGNVGICGVNACGGNVGSCAANFCAANGP